jgi:hypothetical protein
MVVGAAAYEQHQRSCLPKRKGKQSWIPACAGMTKNVGATFPSVSCLLASKREIVNFLLNLFCLSG